jgi:RHS repeat-associated protein
MSPYGDVVLETDATGAPQAGYILGGAELIAQTRAGSRAYYLHDGQGNVRVLADDGGTVTDRYRYGAFGELQGRTGTSVNPYQFNGQQFDALTGLYNLRARWYAPNEGRFVSRDLAALDPFDPAEINRYAYGRNNPIRFEDPTGYTAGAIARPMPRGAAGNDYAALLSAIHFVARGSVAVLGYATACLYMRITSVWLAGVKAGLPLMVLAAMRPDGERCVIPVFIWGFNAVAYHIDVAQFSRGKPMLKTLDRSNRRIVNQRRTAATAQCLSPRPTQTQWGNGPMECDEYPYATTLEGGLQPGGTNASVMMVPALDNGLHGVALRMFYNGGWTNKWRARLDDGTQFATVIVFPPTPPFPNRPAIP